MALIATRMNVRTIARSAALAAVLAAPLVAPAPARAAAARDTSVTLRGLGLAYESARLLPQAAQVAALQRLDGEATALARHDLDGDARAAVRLLSGEIRFRLGRPRDAREQFTRAGDGAAAGTGDDAGFAAIRALEATGRDDEAAKAWGAWEKRWPRSPLAGEAMLAAAWNALRRDDTAAAGKRLDALLAARPWLRADARVTLARATALHLAHRDAEAIAALGPAPAGAPAQYLLARCEAAQGALLRSAAAFQMVAERWPDSPLRDAALLGKANAFLLANDYRSAGQEFARVAERARDEDIQAEAELRAAAARLLAGDAEGALPQLAEVAAHRAGTDVAARAQFLVGATLESLGRPAEAIPELNRVLGHYFQHAVAASAQYRVGRCLDALGRHGDATGAYQAVVAGYPLAAEAPAAAYLAGVGLLAQNRPLQAAPYFQLVLDRYAARDGRPAPAAFATADARELTDAALCMLEYSYHRAGRVAEMSGAPHVMLVQLPSSHSTWRAHALLFDADASAAQGRYAESQSTLEKLTREFPDQPIGAAAAKLLAWTCARQGQDSLAIAIEERLLARWGAAGDSAIVSGTMLDIAHQRFNQKRYREAATAYAEFLKRFPAHPQRLLARYQAGLCALRLERAGDAVDRWEEVVRDSADAPIAERAWARMGDVYFEAERYDDARRAYRGLLEHFAGSTAAAIASLRLGQCDYNAGRDSAALAAFAATSERYPGTPAAREASRGTELALYRLSQSTNGAQVLAQLVERYPSSAFAADAQFQIGRAHYQEQRWAEAAEAFRQVVSRFPGYSGADQAQFLLADCETRLGDADAARQAYEQFVAFFPQSPLVATAGFRLGLAAFGAKEYAAAAIAFTRALEDSAARDVRSPARYNLALCQRLLGHPDDARAEFARWRAEFGAADERAADVAYQLGDLDVATGQNDDAEREFQAALALRPRPALAAEAAFQLGHCREQRGDPDGARRAYALAVTVPEARDPYRLSAVARLAALCESRHEFTRAVALYRDLAANSQDRELAAAAADRAARLQAGARRTRAASEPNPGASAGTP